MSNLNKLISEYTKEWDSLLTKFSMDRNLPFDLDLWPDSDLEDWETLSEGLSRDLNKALAEREEIGRAHV